MRPHDITIVPFTITKLTFRTFMNCRKMPKLLEFLEVEFNSFSGAVYDNRLQPICSSEYDAKFEKQV